MIAKLRLLCRVWCFLLQSAFQRVQSPEELLILSQLCRGCRRPPPAELPAGRRRRHAGAHRLRLQLRHRHADASGPGAGSVPPHAPIRATAAAARYAGLAQDRHDTCHDRAAGKFPSYDHCSFHFQMSWKSWAICRKPLGSARHVSWDRLPRCAPAFSISRALFLETLTET